MYSNNVIVYIILLINSIYIYIYFQLPNKRCSNLLYNILNNVYILRDLTSEYVLKNVIK